MNESEILINTLEGHSPSSKEKAGHKPSEKLGGLRMADSFKSNSNQQPSLTQSEGREGGMEEQKGDGGREEGKKGRREEGREGEKEEIR